MLARCNSGHPVVKERSTLSSSTASKSEDDRASWEEAWSGQLYEDAIALITSQSGQAELAIQYGQITNQSRVLDLGCGPGTLSESMARVAQSVVGVDFLESMIEQAKRMRAGATFRVADGEDLPFEDGGFDVVVCCYTAHHFEQPAKVFGEIRRVLAPNGRVVVLHPIQAETMTFRTIYKGLESVLPQEEVSQFPALAGPLYSVGSPDPYVTLLSDCGFADAVAEKRLKPCVFPDRDALVSAALQIGQIESTATETRDALSEALASAASQYRQDDASYRFPDQLIVARGFRA